MICADGQPAKSAVDSSYAVLHFGIVAKAAAVDENTESYEDYINRHNYGYLLKYDRE